MAVSGCFYGAPGEIRTPDLVVRSHALYPTELRARIGASEEASLACNFSYPNGTQISHGYVTQIYQWMAERVGFEPTMEL